MVAASVLLLASVPVAAGASSTATLTQDGWWNRFQGPLSAGPAQEPANPLRQTVNPQIPKPPSVPNNALAVGGANGEPTSVAAVGFILDDTPGAVVSQLVLTLKEAPGGGNQNAAGAKIAACPITSFWAGARNAAWVDRPSFECADPGAATGERQADGTWKFDLTGLGQSYVDGLLDQNGVALAPAVGATQPFQVTFLDVASGGVTIQYSATPAVLDPATGDFMTPTFSDPVSEAPLDGTIFDTPVSSDPLPVADQPPQALPGAAAPPATETAVQPIAAAAGDLGIPWWAVLLGIISVAFAVALAYALGPAGRPEATGRRSGGVTRALAARGVS